jgi:hypothetical protein
VNLLVAMVSSTCATQIADLITIEKIKNNKLGSG